MRLELDIEVGVLRVGDFERGRVGCVVQQVLGDVAAIKCHPHLRAHADTCEQHMQKNKSRYRQDRHVRRRPMHPSMDEKA